MNVHFIDTSVFVEILKVPNMCAKHDELMKELNGMINSGKDILILPFATIIETGNHIAHNGDGRQRREAAERFSECIKKTVAGEAPWSYYGEQMTKEDLLAICNDFCDFAMRGEGFGDLSIIRAYEKYKAATPGISRIRIWSQDEHLRIYDEEVYGVRRRNH